MVFTFGGMPQLTSLGRRGAGRTCPPLLLQDKRGGQSKEAQMSNPDSFIDEVSEEVRKDRLFGYMRKYGWIAVLVVLLVVGGTAFLEFRKSQATNAAQSVGDEILAALELDDDAERATALAAIDVAGGAAAITGLLAASDLTETGDLDGAVEALNSVAIQEDVPEIYRDIAALKSAMVTEGPLSEDDRRAILDRLATPGGAFRLLAQEQLALMDIQNGEVDSALEKFTAIAQDAEVTGGLRERAFSMIVALDGDLEALIGEMIGLAAQGDQ